MEEKTGEIVKKNNRKRIAIIIISIIQILTAIYAIINVEEIFQSQLKSVQQIGNMYSEELKQQMLERINNLGKNYLIFSGIVLLVSNIVALITAALNKLGKIKTLLITVFAIDIFLSSTDLLLLLTIAELIIMCFIKKDKSKEVKEPRVPKKIPELEYKKPRKSEIILSIILILVYFSDFFIEKIIPSNISTTVARITVLTYYIGLYVLAIFCCKNIIKEDIKLFKSNFKPYMKFILAMYIITKVTVMTILIIKTAITGSGSSTNQETLNQLPIALTAVLAIIWAPVVEETIFRISLRRFIKNDKIFIVVSAITFGAIHVLSEPNITTALINSIPYVLMGGCLAYTYKRTNNGLCSMVLHGIYNLIDVCLMMLLL